MTKTLKGQNVVMDKRERKRKTEIRDNAETATALYEQTTIPHSASSFSEGKARVDTLMQADVLLTPPVQLWWTGVVAETEARQGNWEDVVEIMMPLAPAETAFADFEVDAPKLWPLVFDDATPPDDIDEETQPGTAEYVAHEKAVSIHASKQKVGVAITELWANDAVMDLMENRDLSEYIGLIKGWKTVWDTRLETVGEVPAVIADIVQELHVFSDAVLAVADSQVFTSESHKAFTAVFRPSKGAKKQSQVIRDLIRVIKGNPTWKMLEDDALASASSELHGSDSTIQAVQTKTEDFEQVQFQEAVLAEFTTWRSSLRG